MYTTRDSLTHTNVVSGYRMVLCVSLAIMVAGTLEYILASNIWMILFAQVCIFKIPHGFVVTS